MTHGGAVLELTIKFHPAPKIILNQEMTMKAHQRDRTLLAASRFDAPTRDGEVLEIGGEDGSPSYLVRWADGRLCPEPDSVPRVEAADGQIALAKVILLAGARASRCR